MSLKTTDRKTEIQKPEQLLVRAETAANLCGIGKTLWFELQKQGRTPPSIKLGRARLWKVSDLKKWTRLNCPKVDKYLELQRTGNE